VIVSIAVADDAAIDDDDVLERVFPFGTEEESRFSRTFDDEPSSIRTSLG
jgi:hypothetical protein